MITNESTSMSAQIINADCRGALQRISEHVDLIFCDPPFNFGQDYNSHNDNMDTDEFWLFTEEWLRSVADLADDQTSIWFNLPVEMQAEVCTWMAANDFLLVNHCIWHYRFAQNHEGSFLSSHTHAPWFCRGTPKWRPHRVKIESCRSAEYNDWRADATGQRVPFDVWGMEPNWGRVQGNNKERRPMHPNQLPEKFLERILLCCTDEGDLVVDPFVGSGTTCVVADALGRRSIGIEIDPKYAASASSRILEGAVRV